MVHDSLSVHGQGSAANQRVIKCLRQCIEAPRFYYAVGERCWFSQLLPRLSELTSFAMPNRYRSWRCLSPKIPSSSDSHPSCKGSSKRLGASYGKDGEETPPTPIPV